MFEEVNDPRSFFIFPENPPLSQNSPKGVALVFKLLSYSCSHGLSIPRASQCWNKSVMFFLTILWPVSLNHFLSTSKLHLAPNMTSHLA